MRGELQLSEARAAELLGMMEKCGISTTRELMEWAITAFAWAVEESEQGREIIAIDRQASGFTTLAMPVLQRIQRQVLDR